MSAVEYIRALFRGKNFVRFYFATFWSGVAAVVIWYLLTHDLSHSPTQKEFGNTILGFIMGTVVGSVMQFYFGSSQSSSEKDDVLKNAMDNKT